MNKYLSSSLISVMVVATVVAVAYWQGMPSFLFAWILNFMLMAGVLYFTQTFKPRLTSTYYDSKKWESEGKIYKWFGIHGFRKLLVAAGWEKLNKASNPVKKNLDALIHLERGTRQSEFGHLIIFFIVLALALFVGLFYGFRQSLWLHILNVLFNAYPIAVQRYNRPRLQKAINHVKGVSKSGSDVSPLL